VGYVLQLMEKAGGGLIDVAQEAETNFNTEMQNRLAKLAWAKVEDSWYKDGERVTNNWPGSSLEFKRRLKTPAWNDFKVTS